ncbi:MAG: phytanoyl-CoA dioxygenase family protein [Kiloniellales bacterium]|nr:phytanoyl-CoA dioxygenase family protein [Kiloniellales bacterium]
MHAIQQKASGILSAEQIAAFKRDGFVFVPGFYGPAEMAEITAWTEELKARQETPGAHMVYYEDDLRAPGHKVVQRIEYFTGFHAGFEGLFTGGRMAEATAELLGEPAALFKEKINFKMPGGDGFKPHQDAQAGWNDYASFYITALVSIDESTPENGCLEVVAGWHDKGLVGALWEPLSEEAMAEMDFVACPTKPGDAMFFDSYAPHRSGPNLTESPRRVLYVTYNRASEGDHRERYFAEKRANFPPDIEREEGESYVFRV